MRKALELGLLVGVAVVVALMRKDLVRYLKIRQM